MLLDKLVHATRIGFHHLARFGVEKCGVTLCGAGEAVRSKLFVDENRLGAQNFRKLPAGDAAQQIHLPEAVLCHDVALSLCEIFALVAADRA